MTDVWKDLLKLLFPIKPPKKKMKMLKLLIVMILIKVGFIDYLFIYGLMLCLSYSRELLQTQHSYKY